jgi:hypothetical protein
VLVVSIFALAIAASANRHLRKLRRTMNALNRTILAALAWWLVAAAALLFVAMIVLLP